MRTLLSTTEIFRVDTENEAKELIEEAKNTAIQEGYRINNYASTLKEKKKKGEVIAEGYQVKIMKEYKPFWFDYE